MKDPESQPRSSGDEHWLERRQFRERSHQWRRPGLRERHREEVMRDWFGARAPLEILARRRPTGRIGDVVRRVLDRLGAEGDTLLEEIADKWPQTVGPAVSRQAQPLRIHGSTLYVEVSDSSWLYVLENMHKQDILKRVHDLTKGRITSLRFRAGGGRRP